MTPAEVKRRQDIAVQQNITTLRNRVDELGISEPVVTPPGGESHHRAVAGVQDPNEAIRVLGATATLEFRLVDETNNRQRGRADQAHSHRLEAAQGCAMADRSW